FPKCSGSARFPLMGDVFRNHLATGLPVAADCSTSSLNNRLFVDAHITMNSGKADLPDTSDRASRSSTTDWPEISHCLKHMEGALRPLLAHTISLGASTNVGSCGTRMSLAAYSFSLSNVKRTC